MTRPLADLHSGTTVRICAQCSLIPPDGLELQCSYAGTEVYLHRDCEKLWLGIRKGPADDPPTDTMRLPTRKFWKSYGSVRDMTTDSKGWIKRGRRTS